MAPPSLEPLIAVGVSRLPRKALLQVLTAPSRQEEMLVVQGRVPAVWRSKRFCSQMVAGSQDVPIRNLLCQ